jgi:hypothetical protein
MDKLDQRISIQRARVDDLKRKAAEMQREADQEAVRLEALLEAASLREPPQELVSKLPKTDRSAPGRLVQLAKRLEKRGGRQPGAIDNKWRDYLNVIVLSGNVPETFSLFVANAASALTMEKASVRQRIRQYVAQGHLRIVDGSISVSEAAIDRFNLRHKTQSAPPLSEADNGSGTPSSGE